MKPQPAQRQGESRASAWKVIALWKGLKDFLTLTEPGGEPRLAATLENGQVQLTLTGKQGSRYAIEASTALTNWNSAAITVTVTNQSGAVTFPAPGATSGAQRFYRAVWQ